MSAKGIKSGCFDILESFIVHSITWLKSLKKLNLFNYFKY